MSCSSPRSTLEHHNHNRTKSSSSVDATSTSPGGSISTRSLKSTESDLLPYGICKKPSSLLAGQYYQDENGIERHTTSCLTFSRGWLKHIAQETIDISRQGYYINRFGERIEIAKDLQKAMKGSVHYHSSTEFQGPKSIGPYHENSNDPTQYVVAFGSSLEVAAQLLDQPQQSQSQQPPQTKPKVGILNSASSKHPDKFLRGTISQEECICRASLLYPCLAQYEHLPSHFYFINRTDKYKATSSSCAIFAPDVPIIRQDSVRGELLDSYDVASFVNIPATNAFVVGKQEVEDNTPVIPAAQKPNAGPSYEHITVHDAMYDRIWRALNIFQLHGCTELVLCAFGCGVHGNDPIDVARSMRRCLMDTNLKGHFKTVVFAIQPSRTANYEAFTQIFPEATAS